MTKTRYPHGRHMFVRLLDALGDGTHTVSLSLAVPGTAVVTRSDGLAFLA